MSKRQCLRSANVSLPGKKQKKADASGVDNNDDEANNSFKNSFIDIPENIYIVILAYMGWKAYFTLMHVCRTTRKRLAWLHTSSVWARIPVVVPTYAKGWPPVSSWRRFLWPVRHVTIPWNMASVNTLNITQLLARHAENLESLSFHVEQFTSPTFKQLSLKRLELFVMNTDDFPGQTIYPAAFPPCLEHLAVESNSILYPVDWPRLPETLKSLKIRGSFYRYTLISGHVRLPAQLESIEFFNVPWSPAELCEVLDALAVRAPNLSSVRFAGDKFCSRSWLVSEYEAFMTKESSSVERAFKVGIDIIQHLDCYGSNCSKFHGRLPQPELVQCAKCQQPLCRQCAWHRISVKSFRACPLPPLPLSADGSSYVFENPHMGRSGCKCEREYVCSTWRYHGRCFVAHNPIKLQQKQKKC